MSYCLGVCTWTFGEMPLGEIARRVRALGLDGVELAGDLAKYQPAESARILKDAGLKVLSLTPDDVDLAHPDPAIRSSAVDYYLGLLDFAAQIDHPLVACHGQVGRVRAINSQEEERALFVEAVRRVAARAEQLGLRVVMEVLNRYEAHLLNRAEEAVQFVADVGSPSLGILLDAYHMNIEETDPAAALRLAGSRLWLYHVADSNRQGVGRGHTDFAAQVAALHEVGYEGPVILEATAPGPDPFKAIKDAGSVPWLEAYLRESIGWLRSRL
jgi:D-psicose/D-tagatose/L-ribulose 3-epimerase